MLTITQLFDKEFQKMKSRNWSHIYVVLDIHDTVFKSTYENNAPLLPYKYCIEALQKLSKRSDINLIYWSSTAGNEQLRHIDTLAEDMIIFQDFNKNDKEPSTEYSNFDKKFYMNVILDDKAGFDPENDWEELFNYLKELEKNDNKR